MVGLARTNISKARSKVPTVDVIVGDCIDVLREQRARGVQYDAVLSDLPYEIGLHGSAADQTGVSFSSELWTLFFDVLKPGAFVAAFAATRNFHRLATAAEDAGFNLYPFLVWRFGGGLPKPTNVSELFDRDAAGDRRIVGYRDGSGFTKANVQHSAQRRTKTEFAVRERHVSDEARKWSGFFYGLNALAPSFEPILLAQCPIAASRMIDNIRQHGTGALNVGALRRRNASWPSTILDHRKARQSDHGSSHPSVKPVSLMEELALLFCPTGCHILDPFAGTGTTGVAAIRHGFSVTLIEQNAVYKTVIQRRLQMARIDQAQNSTAMPSPEPLPKGIRRRARVTPPEIVAAKKTPNQAKVAAYRDRLAERGLRSVQLWVWDTSTPEFIADADRQARSIAQSQKAAVDDNG